MVRRPRLARYSGVRKPSSLRGHLSGEQSGSEVWRRMSQAEGNNLRLVCGIVGNMEASKVMLSE